MSALTGGGPTAAALAARMADAWIAFARSGDPNTASLPTWSPYDIHNRPTMVLDDECRIANDPDMEVRRLWATV